MEFLTAFSPVTPGNPMDGDEFADGHHPKAYTFATVHHVAEYARRQLAKLKPGVDPDSAGGRPFTLLFASEQGWPFPSCCDNVKRGRNICYAHALAADTPAMVAVTHNFFQDNPAGSEQGGQDYGLIPGNVSGDLSNGPGNPTFDAYNSTSPLVWEASNDHYCCSRWSMGCRNKSIHGVFDPIALATGTLTAHGWAWDEAAGGGGSAPVSVRVSIDTEGATVTTLANVSRPDVVAAGATPNKDHGFLVTLDVRALQGDGKMHKVSVAALPATASGVPKLLMPSPQCFRGAAVVPCGGAHAHEMAA